MSQTANRTQLYTPRGHKLECQNFILTGESKTFALLKKLIHDFAHRSQLSTRKD